MRVACPSLFELCRPGRTTRLFMFQSVSMVSVPPNTTFCFEKNTPPLRYTLTSLLSFIIVVLAWFSGFDSCFLCWYSDSYPITLGIRKIYRTLTAVTPKIAFDAHICSLCAWAVYYLDRVCCFIFAGFFENSFSLMFFVLLLLLPVARFPFFLCDSRTDSEELGRASSHRPFGACSPRTRHSAMWIPDWSVLCR